MLNKTKIALAAALIAGSASVAVAGEGSADLANPPGYDLTHSAPQPARAHHGARDSARDAYGDAGERAVPQRSRGFSSGQESFYWQHGSGGIDQN